MKNKVKLLCPSKKCKKCIKISNQVMETVRHLDADAEIEIIDQLEGWLQFQTWILPTVIINEQVVARGYAPSKEKIMAFLTIPEG